MKGGEPLLTQPMYASRTPKIVHQGNFIVTKDSPHNYVLNAKNILAATLVIYFTNLLLSTWVPLIEILTTLTSPNHTLRYKHILNSVPVQDRLQPMLRFPEELQIFWGRGLFVVGSCRNEDKILSRKELQKISGFVEYTSPHPDSIPNKNKHAFFSPG